jgi:hypothetical protein
MQFQRFVVGGLCAISVFASVGHPSARSASQMRRELRRMVGYTVIGATTIQDSRDDRNGQRFIILANGLVFRLDSFSAALAPSDVVVFASSSSRGYAPQTRATPSLQYEIYRLLLDDEIVDVTRVQ